MENKPLTTIQYLKLVRELGEQLHEIHQAGVVHRSISPDNVVFSENHWILVGFGDRCFADDCYPPSANGKKVSLPPADLFQFDERNVLVTTLYAVSDFNERNLHGLFDNSVGVDRKPDDQFFTLSADVLQTVASDFG